MKPSNFIADFDSASGILRATSAAIQDKKVRLITWPRPARSLVPLVNWLPRRTRQQVYKYGGWGEAIPPRRLEQFDAEAVAEWVAGHYPQRRYPAAVIGSASGAAPHLCAALGIPWLPQTMLVPVRQTDVHPDDMQASMEAGRATAQPLLQRNPQIQLHHMHDANQDRLMVQKMTYFRIKYRRLSAAYERFLEQALAPGATLFVSECNLTWPTTKVAERHYFQGGALGGVTPDEIMHGSERVAEFLARSGSPRRRWQPPQPDAERPEAEWGFEPALRDDLLQLAKRRGYRLRRMVFGHPQDLSPVAADLYRWWYRRTGIPCDRLLVESFILFEPLLAMKKGLIPYWTFFPVDSAADRLSDYLTRADDFQDIYMTLFSHGVESAGYASIDRWRRILAEARETGRFLGVSERAFPGDFAAFTRYHRELKKLPNVQRPERMTLQDLNEFFTQSTAEYDVRWVDEDGERLSQPASESTASPSP